MSDYSEVESLGKSGQAEEGGEQQCFCSNSATKMFIFH